MTVTVRCGWVYFNDDYSVNTIEGLRCGGLPHQQELPYSIISTSMSFLILEMLDIYMSLFVTCHI